MPPAKMINDKKFELVTTEKTITIRAQTEE